MIFDILKTTKPAKPAHNGWVLIVIDNEPTGTKQDATPNDYDDPQPDVKLLVVA